MTVYEHQQNSLYDRSVLLEVDADFTYRYILLAK